MHAPRRQHDPVRLEEAKLFMDFLYIAFTVTFLIIVGKYLVTTRAVEIVDFMEGDDNRLSLFMVMNCMCLILLYTAHFYYRKRYLIIAELAAEFFSSARSNVLQVRSSFRWLRSLLALLQLPRETCLVIHATFKAAFMGGLCALVTVIGYSLVMGHELEFLLMNFVPMGTYFAAGFSQGSETVDRAAAHLGYLFLHGGILISYYDYDVVSYICINTGLAIFILCIVWHFVNVPVRGSSETPRVREGH